MSELEADSEGPGARCHRHPERPAVASCERCGNFLCAGDRVLLDRRVYCATCSARPDVDYLEAYRLKYWGKRDAWAWLFGLGGLYNVVAGPLLVLATTLSETRERAGVLALGALLTLVGINNLCFFFGVKWSRYGVVASTALFGLAQVFTLGPAGLITLAFGLAITASILLNTRNKLFFEMEVSREALKKSWDIYSNNRLARSATLAGIAGLLLGIFAPVALVAGILALRRVDPNAHPPIGNRGYAIAGIVLGVVGTLLWGGILVASLAARR